jgi:DNA-directed RNA polymerase beta subunit
MTQKGYDLYRAGRYKLNKKLYLTDRIYNRILTANLHGTNLKAGQYIEKNEIDIIRKLFVENKFTNTIKFDFNLENKILRKQSNVLNFFDVYASPTSTKLIRMLAPAKFIDHCNSFQLIDFISIFSYASNVHSIPTNYDDIENLQNKRIKLINEQLKAKLLIGISRIEKKVREKLASL